VVTSLERARDLPNPPAVVAAAAQGSGEGQDMMTSYYRDDLCGLPEMSVVARQLWATSDCGPTTCRRRSSTTTSPLRALPARRARLLRQGRGQGLVADGRIELGGALPINTHGGQLGEAYLHGMNGIAGGRAPRAWLVGQSGARARARGW